MKTTNDLLSQLKQLYAGTQRAAADKKQVIQNAMPGYRPSAANLIDYLSVRSLNVEPLQRELHNLGLSSLASSEGHIRAQLIKVMGWLGHDGTETFEVDAESGRKLLNHNIQAVFGRTVDPNVPPIMVTFDSHFSEDLELIYGLLQHGMQVARINCAHDDERIWLKMISNLNAAKERTRLSCKVYMDMAGPKIRTEILNKKNKPGRLKVETGENIFLTDQAAALNGEKGIRCTQTGIVERLKPGNRVFFDDGMFEAVVEQVERDLATLKITRISSKKPVIKNEKGINFPDTVLQISPITDYDQQCLPFIAQHADMVGYSFVNSAQDMQQLQLRLAGLNRPDMPVVAKIETQQAVNNLPAIILQGMCQNPTGIMIARGDLAVEIGFERLSEIQEEILWICEAAHTPVIWATQVMESMNKAGLATRGEVTDAAQSADADCVMINKGGHTIEVLKSLGNILSRSRENNFKNSRLFRRLSIAQHFIKAV